MRRELILGDCLDVLPTIADGSVGMVFADLPYGTTRNRWDSKIDLGELWTQLRRVARPGAAFVFTAQMPFTAEVLMSNPRWFRHHWVWEKTNATGHLNAKRAPMKAHEDVLVFCERQPTYNPQKTQGHERKVSSAASKARTLGNESNWGTQTATSYDSTERYPRTVQTFAADKQKLSLHRTQKPLAMVEYFLRTYALPGDLVLDPTAGSGTTGAAADLTGNPFVLIEGDAVEGAKAAARLDLTAAPAQARAA